MLVAEGCMPSCPFKREHDDLQIYHRKINYWDSHLSVMTCNRWIGISGASIIPRFGTNCYWTSVDTLQEYAELVDIFKHGGRLKTAVPPLDSGCIQFGWCTGKHAVKSFSDIIENRLEPVYSWVPLHGIFSRLKTDIKEIKEDLKEDFFMTDEAKKLEQKIKNCKNQCYKCHLCERTYRLPDIDSLIKL